MLSEDRVRLMTKMAIFEQNTRNEYLPFTSINKKDYVGSRRLVAFIVFTLGYAACAAGMVLLMLLNMQIAADIETLTRVALIVILLYLLLVIVLLHTVHRMSSKRYKREIRRIEQYKKSYDELEELYRQEAAATSPKLESVDIATEKFKAEQV